ncbi:Fumigaclavine B O-acetyltransferase easN [Trichoderma ghanense]|uniref:Fumigaclavine B O-acetyltransferase easN n=1 Tax=Trichoderma ghanense TaxID=65468 RepID=A0ABY2GUG3_9HYPO
MDAEYLSPIDQILPRMYFGEILCFPSTNEGLFPILKQGLSKVAVNVPQITSFVLNDDSRPGNIRLNSGRDSIDKILVYREDLVADMPEYEMLRMASFPIFPNSPLFYPHIPEVPWAAPWPVIRAEVTRFRGGFILVVLAHHCVFDGVALSELLDMWAASCRDPLGPPPEVRLERLNRRAILENTPSKQSRSQPSVIFRASDRRRLLPNFISLLQRPFNSILPKPLQPCWPITMYRLPSHKLHSLKTTLNQFASRLGLRFLSTNDVLCALIWSCATMAMSPNFQPWTSSSRCSTGVSVNVRSKLQPRLPGDFLGCAIGIAYIDMARRNLLAAAGGKSLEMLASVAAAIRRGVDGVTNEKMKDIISFVETEGNTSNLQWRPKRLNDFYIASWAHHRIYDADWGPKIGKCEALRVAQMSLMPMCVILPARDNHGLKENQPGDIEVAISLNSSHMERFRKLKLMREFAETIGV